MPWHSLKTWVTAPVHTRQGKPFSKISRRSLTCRHPTCPPQLQQQTHACIFSLAVQGEQHGKHMFPAQLLCSQALKPAFARGRGTGREGAAPCHLLGRKSQEQPKVQQNFPSASVHETWKAGRQAVLLIPVQLNLFLKKVRGNQGLGACFGG